MRHDIPSAGSLREISYCRRCGAAFDDPSPCPGPTVGPAMTQERAQELWDARGMCWHIFSADERDGGMTPAEDAYVRRVWDTIPSGSSCWMDAFMMILKGEDPLAT